VQDFRGELHLAAAQIVFTQEEAQRLNGKEITAACVAEDVSPAAGILILSPRRPVTDEPLPALTTILPPKGAARPESRSFPVMITLAKFQRKMGGAVDLQAQPAGNPARSICLGARKNGASDQASQAGFDGGNFLVRMRRSAGPFRNTQAVFVPPPSTPGFSRRGSRFVIISWFCRI
jgi:hypothetical protein